jgi:hypothetical protein
MRNLYLPTIIVVLMAVVTSNAYGDSGESVVLDPNTGDYLITYYGAGAPGDKQHKILRKVIFVPATKIDPMVASAFRLQRGGEVVYSYRVTNGLKSRQPLISMLFDPVTDIVSSLPLPKRQKDIDLNTITQVDAAGVTAITTPENWIGRNTTSRMGGLRIGWSYGDLSGAADGLAPGKTQAGFGFSSKDIPGIGMAQMQGDTPIEGGYPDDGPSLKSEVIKQLEPIEKNDFVTRPAAVPMVAVPEPFDAAVLLDRIQTQMHTWIGMQLLDVSFSTQFDRNFQSATSAYRLNQPKVGKKQIQTMRELIKKEYEDLGRDEEHESDKSQEKNDDKKSAMIDRLAARVLDFDLKYVTKRMDGDKDD